MAIQTEEQLKRQKQDLEAKNAKEMANLKELLKSQGINLDKSHIPWTHLIGGKKIVNPQQQGNRWVQQAAFTDIQISADGLNANKNIKKYQSISAEKGFNVSAYLSGPICYYFEVIRKAYSGQIFVGLSSGSVPENDFCVGLQPNSYAIQEGSGHYWLSGKSYPFEWPNGASKPDWNDQGEVFGCGLVLTSNNKWSLFFTRNGVLMGKQISINSTLYALYPTLTMFGNVSVEANFGDDSAKPFRYNIDKCPGLYLDD